MKMTLLTLSLVILQASFAQAASQTVLNLGNDRDSNVAKLIVQSDASGAFQKFTYIGGGGSKNFSAAEVANGNAVLEAQQGVNALTLVGNVSTGKLGIKYVANGLSGSYKTCDMTLAHNTKGEFAIVNANTGKVVQSAKVITWGMGISTIEGICPK